ncbi:MAG: NUDIX hydrolase [Pseudonocardia sp.]
MAWTLVVVGVLLLALTVTWCVSRARRLDRLHVRLDAARAGLVAALDRRAAVALRLDGSVPSPTGSAGAGAAATLAEREDAESALTRRLAALDRVRLGAAVHVELADAEHLVVLARRVHNDAVRDTLALRSRRLVRWLRLAGTAPEPAYFDIAEPEPERPSPRLPDVTQRAPAAPGTSRTLGRPL